MKSYDNSRVISISTDMFHWVEQRAEEKHVSKCKYLSHIVSVYKKAYENKQRQAKEKEAN